MPAKKAILDPYSVRQIPRTEPLLVPVSEASRLLSLNRATIRDLVRRGSLAAKKISPTKWLITTASIKSFANKAA
jgi:excisionase family DNA binding protein